jgi:hypothetical protein
MRAKTYVVLLTAVALVFLLPYPNFPVAANPELKSKHLAIKSKAKTFVKYLGRFHPIAVHFPIAFTFGALLTELLFLTTGRSSLVWRLCLMLYPRL